MEVLVTGGSGGLGSQVARIAGDRGHRIRLLSRKGPSGPGWYSGDIATGEGLGQATTGVDVIIHCASDPRNHKSTDVTGTGHLVGAAEAAGVSHLVFPGIVGSDVIPYAYYQSKVSAEKVLEGSNLGVTIQRYTQFHDLLWHRLSKVTKRPLVVVPNNTRFQVLDACSAARCLVDAAEAGPQGRLTDLGGPTIYDVRDLARSVATALNRSRRVIGLNRPGLVGAAFRAGANLTPNRDEMGSTWNDFVAARMESDQA